jgi:hypothetical protein
MDIKKERKLGGNTFYVRPFGAFTSARLGGDVMHFMVPLIGGFASLAQHARGAVSLVDIDVSKVLPIVADGISGEKLERILKQLLVTHNNISVQLEGEKAPKQLDEDLADEVFCGDTQDMFILAWDVIAANFSGFFKKLVGPSGNLDAKGLLEAVQTKFANMAS